MKDRFEDAKSRLCDARRRVSRLLGEVDESWKLNAVDRSRLLLNAALATKALIEAEAVLAMAEIQVAKNADLFPMEPK